MTDLIERIKAAIDEDERIARAATPGGWIASGDERPWVHDGHFVQVCGGAEWSGMGREDADHIARHDPARVLRQATANRQILELHTPTADDPGLCPQCNWDAQRLGRPCSTVMLIAATYGLVPQLPLPLGEETGDTPSDPV